MPTMNSGSSLLVDVAFASAEKQAHEKLTEREEARNRTLIAPASAHPAPPTEPLTQDRMGAVIGMGHAVRTGNTAIALNEVFTNFQPTGSNHPHGAISPFDANDTCTLRPIGANEKLVNVNIMRTADFDTPPDFHYYDGEPGDLKCMTSPYRKPDESWGAWNGAKRGNSLDGNLLFGQDKGFDAYDHWFTETLGVSATTNLIGAAQVGAVLLGEVPSAYLSVPTRHK